MNEWMLRKALEGNDEPLSEKAIDARLARARKAERLLNTDLDYIVASDDRMYHALLLLKGSDAERRGNLQNALRWYYRAIHSRAFPSLDSYSSTDSQTLPNLSSDTPEQAKRMASRHKGLAKGFVGQAEPIGKLWNEYCSVRKRITAAFGRTNNVVGEIGERIVAECHEGELLDANYSSADVKLSNGKLIQVKARMCSKGRATSLGVIRSWNFDLLSLVLFDANGSLTYGGEIPSDAARKHARESAHVNGWVITTNKEFLSNPLMVDMTEQYAKTLENL